MKIKLSEYADREGVSYKTAWLWFRDGKIPNAEKLPTGSIRVNIDTPPVCHENVVIYARVSSSKQRSDLDRQVERLLSYTAARGYQVSKVYKEVASGVNDNRKELNKILTDKTITKIIVENRDRLTRFGFNYIETLLDAEIEVVNKLDTDKSDLIQDLTAIVYSFSARMYSRRKAKDVAECVKNGLS
jgi:predicted site-specific integrase-resolvase